MSEDLALLLSHSFLDCFSSCPAHTDAPTFRRRRRRLPILLFSSLAQPHASTSLQPLSWSGTLPNRSWDLRDLISLWETTVLASFRESIMLQAVPSQGIGQSPMCPRTVSARCQLLPGHGLLEIFCLGPADQVLALVVLALCFVLALSRAQRRLVRYAVDDAGEQCGPP